MSTNGLTRSAGRWRLGKYVETKKPSPTQWNDVLLWMPSTVRRGLAVDVLCADVEEGAVVVMAIT
jgi:hypothetical protein